MTSQKENLENALVVDDEQKWRIAGREALRELGFYPKPCEYAQEAIDALDHDQNKNLKLILLDYDLTETLSPASKSFGIHIVRRLHDLKREDVKVVLYSSVLTEEKRSKIATQDPDYLKHFHEILFSPYCNGDYIYKGNYPAEFSAIQRKLKSDLEKISNVMRLLDTSGLEGKKFGKLEILDSSSRRGYPIVTRVCVGWDKSPWSFDDGQGTIVGLLATAFEAASPWVTSSELRTRLKSAGFLSESTAFRMRDFFTKQLSTRITDRPLEIRDILVPEPALIVKMIKEDTAVSKRPIRNALLKHLATTGRAIDFTRLRDLLDLAISEEDFSPCTELLRESLQKARDKLRKTTQNPKYNRAEDLLGKKRLNEGERRLLNWLIFRAAYPGTLGSPLECYHPAWCTLIYVAELRKSSYRLDPSFSHSESKKARRKRIDDKQ